jgi:hypothetical protein
MSDRAYRIIDELANEYGHRLDLSLWPEDVLCDGETCRHSECECWDSFHLKAERLIKEQMEQEDIPFSNEQINFGPSDIMAEESE